MQNAGGGTPDARYVVEAIGFDADVMAGGNWPSGRQRWSYPGAEMLPIMGPRIREPREG